MPRRTPFEIHGPGWYTAKQAARFTGHSFDMVNYLCRHHLVEPSCDCKRGHGSARHYCFGDLVALRLIAKLAASGIAPLRLKKGMQYIKKVRPDIKFSKLPADYVVTDGRNMYLREKGDVLERATDGQYAFAFVIELDQVRKEVKRRMTPFQRKLAAMAA
jgi:hypothetical protein